MDHKNSRLILLGLSILFGLISFSQPHAAVAAEPTFMVAPVIPKDNRVAKQNGYFDLILPATGTRTLHVTAYNTGKQPLKIKAQILDAKTLTNGKVQYVPAAKIDRALLKNPGSQIASVASNITLAPGKTQDIPITLTAAAGQKPATYLSALQLISQPETSSTQNVTNRIEYTIGLVLHQKTASSTLTGITVELAKIKHNASGFTLRYQLKNTKSVFLKNVTAKIAMKSATTQLFDYQKTRVLTRIAPRSAFAFTQLVQGQKLNAGFYRINYRFSQSDKLQKRQQYVYINRAGKLVMASKTSFQLAQQWWLIAKIAVGFIIGVIVLIIVVRRIRRRRKNVKEVVR